jgi:acyl dehydratase
MTQRNCGLYYEELEVGRTYEHRPGRTMTEFDNTLWSLLSVNLQPPHINADFAEDSPFGQRLVNSMLTMSVIIGLQVHDLTLGTTVANLGFEEVQFPEPVFIGDTLYAETEVVDKRRSESRDDSGIVSFEHRGRNQDGDVVCTCKRAGLMLYRPDESA